MEKMPFADEPNSVFARLAEVAAIDNLTKEERACYERELREYNDYKNAIDLAKEEGREEGQETERIKIAKALKAEGASTQMIVKCTGLTEEEIAEL